MHAPEPTSRTSPSASDPLDLAGRLAGDVGALDDFVRAFGAPEASQGNADTARFLPRRVDASEATVERDLAKLVLTLVDLVRRLMEAQAIRRVNGGSLSDDEVERMGETFLKLDRRMTELRAAFGLEREDLSLSLGAIRDLLDESGPRPGAPVHATTKTPTGSWTP